MTEWKLRDHPMYAENWRLVDCATEEVLAIVRYPSSENNWEAFIRGASAGEWESCGAAKSHVESHFARPDPQQEHP
jgi:hypothetical protein